MGGHKAPRDYALTRMATNMHWVSSMTWARVWETFDESVSVFSKNLVRMASAHAHRTAVCDSNDCAYARPHLHMTVPFSFSPAVLERALNGTVGRRAPSITHRDGRRRTAPNCKSEEALRQLSVAPGAASRSPHRTPGITNLGPRLRAANVLNRRARQHRPN